MSQRLGRRTFVRCLGAGAASLPFVPAAVARALDPTPVRRLVIWWTPNGLVDTEWAPSGGERDFALGRILEPLAGFREHLIVPQGLDWRCHLENPVTNDHPHPLSQTLCAIRPTDATYGGGPSIDQFIAQRLESPTPFRSVVLGVQTNTSDFGRLSYRAARAPVTQMRDPVEAFDRLFGSVEPGDGDAARRLAERRSILDVIAPELVQLRAELGPDGYSKLDEHLGRVRAIEQRLSENVTACATPDLGAIDGPHDYVVTGRRQMANLAASLGCGVTRVGLLQWHVASSNRTFPWLGFDDVHHRLSHWDSGGSRASQTDKLVRIGRWYAEQLRELLTLLDAMPEGAGTVLDQTMVVWTSEHRTPGDFSRPHARDRVPFVMTGGGYFRGGRRLDYSGRAHADLYVSLCHAMGLTDVSTFGDPSVCRGPLPGLA